VHCPKCNGDMQPGFIPDFGYGSILPSSWMEGEAAKNWMGNVKIKGKPRLPTSADRCVKCGFLELYAKL
jgi:Domain of unknown function (DUF6487)